MRGAVFLLVALFIGPPAANPSIEISTRMFAPAASPLTITAQLEREARVGVRLANSRGKPLGWIERPAKRSRLYVLWNGRLAGRPVRDGSYRAQLVVGGKVVSSAEFRLDRTPARLDDLRVTNGSVPFAGDGPLLATLTPNGDGFRDYAQVRFTLTEPAEVTLDVQRTTSVTEPVYTETWQFERGAHAIGWVPAAGLAARTYVLSLRTEDTSGNTLTYGSANPYVGRHPRAPVVRIQGVDAAFTKQSFAPGDVGELRIATDTPKLELQVFRTGPEDFVTYADYLLEGVPVTEPETIDWASWRDKPNPMAFTVGRWASGLYFVKLTAEDGQVGYAPFVVRPAVLGRASRVAVVLPTNTWQAYNFWDADGDGWGDTWYAGPPNQRARRDRPYLRRGVPPFFYRYDQGFLHWLYWNDKTVDFLAETDVDALSGDELARAYNLVIYSGHSEYVTPNEYDAIERYRNLGGNLMFLSANNFFWRVDQGGPVLLRSALWREIGRPEAALIGVQYLANDRGERQGLYRVIDPAHDPWLWAGTGFEPGSTFGSAVGGYGIEIDHTAPASPSETVVVAEITDLFGPGLSGQMTYYETAAGAKVFAAGALDFGGSATTEPVSQILENLWARLSRP